jgi:hypothetical protein
MSCVGGWSRLGSGIVDAEQSLARALRLRPELGVWTTLAGQGAGVDELVQRGNRWRAIGGQISPIEIRQCYISLRRLWLS